MLNWTNLIIIYYGKQDQFDHKTGLIWTLIDIYYGKQEQFDYKTGLNWTNLIDI